jgi:hypothetical protein
VAFQKVILCDFQRLNAAVVSLCNGVNFPYMDGPLLAQGVFAVL